MKIVFVPSAIRDIGWFRHYYTAVFPAGDKKAQQNLRSIQTLLATNPYIGTPSREHDGVRQLRVPKTPFTLIYRVTEVQIEILRLWDERQGHSY